MIRKEEIKKHIVILDTNILWYKDKSIVVNPEFDSFWQTYSKESNLHLAIPEVVKGEILYQQTTSALKQMEKASQSVSEICAITDYKYSLRLTSKRIKQQIEKRFNKWLKSKKADLLPPPTATINWEDIIRASSISHATAG